MLKSALRLNQGIRSTFIQTRSFSTLIEKKGLKFEQVEEGQGKEAVKGDTVSVHYVGKLDNGKVFDESTKRGPFQFRLGDNQVIQGWEVGVEGMKIGGKRTLHIPFSMAYGERGYPPVIPPRSNLTFEVNLLGIRSK